MSKKKIETRFGGKSTRKKQTDSSGPPKGTKTLDVDPSKQPETKGAIRKNSSVNKVDATKVHEDLRSARDSLKPSQSQIRQDSSKNGPHGSETLTKEGFSKSPDPKIVREGLISSSTPVLSASDKGNAPISPKNDSEITSPNRGGPETHGKASNDPKTQESYISTRRQSQETAEEESAAETTPLLHGSDLENWAGVGLGVSARARSVQNSFARLFRNLRVLKIFGFLLVLGLLVFVFIMLIDFRKLADSAFTMDLQNVSILDLSDAGVAVQVAGTIETNYTDIPNIFLRHLTRITAVFIGGIVVKPRDNCRVYVSTEDTKNVHFFDISPSEISVDLIDHRVSDFEFISDISFVDENAARVFGSILSHDFTKALELDIEVRSPLRVSGSWFRFCLKEASFFQSIQISPDKEAVPLKIQDFGVNDRFDLTEVNLSLSLPALPMNFAIGQIEWDLALMNCDSHASKIGNWTSSSLKVDPVSSTNVSIWGSLDELPSPLLKMCPDGMTPINKFINSVINERIIKFTVKASSSTRNRNTMPEWLYNALTLMSANVSLPVPEVKGFSGELHNYGLSLNSSSVLVKTDGNGRLRMTLDAKADLEVDSLPSNFNQNVSATDISSKLVLSEHNTKFLEALVSGESEVYWRRFPFGSGLFSLDSHNVSVAVIEPRIAGRLLGSTLTNGDFALPDWSLDVYETRFQSRLISTILRNLHFQSSPNASQAVARAPRRENSTFLDWLLKSAEISTDRIFCVSTSAAHAEFLVDLQITNPLDISVGVINDVVTFDLKYNDTIVGVVQMENVRIPSSLERVPLTASMSIFYESSAQRVVVEDFISHIISGSNSTYFGIAGSRSDSLKVETDLSKLLQEIKVDGIKFPELNFSSNELVAQSSQISGSKLGQHESLKIKEDDAKGKQSPFLVDATFHLWSSEIELTLFNPIANVELKAQIIKCLASYEGESLADIDWSEVLIIPPGIHATPRIPIKIASGIGAEILRKAINGGLAMDVVAELSVLVDEFPAELMYRGTGLTAKVKI